MPNMSVGGLVSGLDTATIISQLMQLEARPQTMLKSKVTTEQKVVAALQERPETAAIPILVITSKRVTAEDRASLNGNVTAIMQKASFRPARPCCRCLKLISSP